MAEDVKDKAAPGDVPGTAPVPEPGVTKEAPEVLAERGGVVLRLADWTLTAFATTLGEGEDAATVTVTNSGLRVTKAQAKQVQAAARSHGVELTEETAE